MQTFAFSLLPFLLFSQTNTISIQNELSVKLNPEYRTNNQNERDGFEIPFIENWDLGNFQANEWDHSSCDNWEISGQNGNPLPSAEFKWDPPRMDYSCRLVSNLIYGSHIIDGELWLHYEVMLEDRNENGSENFKVAIIRNDTVFSLSTYANNGDFDWIVNDILITDLAKGFDFKVAFIPNGESSININGWFVDNIHVYRKCRPPQHLEGEFYDNPWRIELTWIEPYATIKEWFTYNDSTFENAFCSTNGGYGLAQLFDMEDYPEVPYPFTITEVRYFNDGSGSYYQQEEIYVLNGNGNTILAGPYIVEDQAADTWVNIQIDPVEIEEGNFMIATINTHGNGPRIGVDDSFYNATLYFGTISDWTELGELGAYYYVGSHEAYIEYQIGKKRKASNLCPPSLSEENYKHADIENRGVTGYNIWRFIDNYSTEWEKLNITPITETQYIDTVLSVYSYYNYYVTAIYDQCESDSSANTRIEYYFPGITQAKNYLVKIFPNPVKDLLNIETNSKILSLDIINQTGTILIHKNGIDECNIKIELTDLSNGLYFLRIETGQGILNKKFVVNK